LSASQEANKACRAHRLLNMAAGRAHLHIVQMPHGSIFLYWLQDKLQEAKGFVQDKAQEAKSKAGGLRHVAAVLSAALVRLWPLLPCRL
jgi:hypothetical protein